MRSSRLKGFFKLDRGERLDSLREFGELPVDQTRTLGKDGALPFELADLFIENAIGSFPLPLGIGTNFRVNGRDYIVPMAVEESSVVAAASNAARWAYETGGFQAQVVSNLMIGQIQILGIRPEDFDAAELKIHRCREAILKMANEVHPRLLMRGGGARGLEVRKFPFAEIPFLVVHVLIDPKDAMGANIVNSVCEKVAPYIEQITEGQAGLKILSNLADRRTFKATVRIKPDLIAVQEPGEEIDGLTVARKIHEAWVFAHEDTYRATTHNKGIMNGIDPVVIATGNDWRAIESGCHAFAARSGQYRSLSRWYVDTDKMLCGELEVPLQVGTVGGVTRLHPLAQFSLSLLGNPNSQELGCVIASVGLASNLSALRALVTTGIQRGHMKLHAKNLALAAGARGKEVEIISTLMVRDKKISASHAERALEMLRGATGNQNLDIDPSLSPSSAVNQIIRGPEAWS
jgi:hydroxymethylglutaryl-CoA reductase